MIRHEKLVDRFTYHKTNERKNELIESIRGQGLELSAFIDCVMTDGREKELALTKIEEAVMWANKGISSDITKD